MRNLLLIPRNLAFYAAFYIGSVFVVLACVATLLLASRETFVRTVHSWSLYHRWCMRNLLGLRVRVEGSLPPGPVFVAMKHESYFEAIDIPQVVRETIRDVGLTASGLLACEIGGPGVYPPQPEGIYAFTQQRKFWPATEGDDRYRRGLLDLPRAIRSQGQLHTVPAVPLGRVEVQQEPDRW